MARENLGTPLSDILTRDESVIIEAPLTADANGYVAGDLLTYDGAVFSKASLASGDTHTESFAVVYEPVGANVKKGVIITLGGVRESLLSQAYQDLSDDDKKAVRKELVAKNILVENI
jgi:hypothetical protein